MKDDSHGVEEIDPYGMMFAMHFGSGIFTADQLRDVGFEIEEGQTLFMHIDISGPVAGITNDPDTHAKIMVNADDAALLAAIILCHFEATPLRTTFLAKYDQNVARVRENIRKAGGVF